jgi:GxxExxY protein
MDIEAVGKAIVNCSIKVHKTLGPGLLESVYQRCLAYELEQSGFNTKTEVLLPVRYAGLNLDMGFRADMIIENAVIVENKTVEKIAPIHEAQLLTYLKTSGLSLGFILNWNTVLMKDGIKRLVNSLP